MAHICRTVLAACRRASTSQEFASLFVKQVAIETGSEFCVWMDRPGEGAHPAIYCHSPKEFIAQHGLLTDYAAAARELSRAAATCGPGILSEPPETARGIVSFAAVPLKVRSEICGVLAVGNRAGGYHPDHLGSLEEMGSAALLRWEYLRREEAMGMESPFNQALLADLAHELRQPLSAIELLAAFLEITLPANETLAREHLQEIRLQVMTADCILSRVAGADDAPPAQPDLAGGKTGAPLGEARFAFTNDTIASVTH